MGPFYRIVTVFLLLSSNEVFPLPSQKIEPSRMDFVLGCIYFFESRVPRLEVLIFLGLWCLPIIVCKRPMCYTFIHSSIHPSIHSFIPFDPHAPLSLPPPQAGSLICLVSFYFYLFLENMFCVHMFLIYLNGTVLWVSSCLLFSSWL